MTVVRWHESNREQLTELLPEALVLVPIGATEQHGPHLATGTDWMLARAVTERAALYVAGRSARSLVITPPVAFGASDHHLPFGGTLSLTAETMQAVLIDLARSAAASGVRRLVLVNGHGGNTGACHAAAAAASTRYDLTVGHVDYWRLIPAEDGVPGHAGAFETSMMLALDPQLVAERRPRDRQPEVPVVRGIDLHAAAAWARLDGYTDHPERGSEDQGKRWFDQLVAALGSRLIDLAEAL